MESKNILAVLLGSALGDACGYPVEFHADPSKYYQRGLFLPVNRKNVAVVTDDTQMMLRVAFALYEAHSQNLDFKATLKNQFVLWFKDPENNRAPGNTCLSACKALIQNVPWEKASIITSKGCGANMRVQPIGCLDPYFFSDKDLFDLASLQSAFTHGNPTALVASALTAKAIRLLLWGCSKEDLVTQLKAWLNTYKGYYPKCLGDIYKIAGYATPQAYMLAGYEECLKTLNKVDSALSRGDSGGDVCDITGQGWVAEEALGSALLAFLWSNSGANAIHRACLTKGDSDSIACMAGAMAGAFYGMEAWPAWWFSSIEYRQDLVKSAVALSKLDRLFY